MSEEESKPQVKEEAGAGAATEYINLIVKEQSGQEMHFKIKKKTPFKKLMDAYCQRMGLTATGLRFTFEGNKLNPDEKPSDKEMDDGDIIDVMVEQTGGSA